MIKVKNNNRKVNSGEYYYFIQDEDGINYLFTESHVIQAIQRAQKNPEDIPKEAYIKEQSICLMAFIIGAFLGAFLGAIVLLSCLTVIG